MLNDVCLGRTWGERFRDADPGLTFWQAVADLRGPCHPSHGRRQGEAINEVDVITG